MNNKETHAFLRVVTIDDAEVLLEIQSEVAMENKYLISVIEEFELSIEKQRDSVQSTLENPRETLIVAEAMGFVVGYIVFRSNKTLRLSHTGTFTTMIKKDYRGLGIGKLLITELLNWAEQNPLIEKVSLGVLSTNQRAIALYKSVGFEEEGRKVKEVKFHDGLYVDDVLMYKLV